jgi:hypothetical protein
VHVGKEVVGAEQVATVLLGTQPVVERLVHLHLGGNQMAR